MSREVLRAIGIGERTVTNIARAAGGIAHTAVTRATDVLAEKRVAAELPLSLRPSKGRRYRVADPYLRLWLAFLDPHMAEIERMRGRSHPEPDQRAVDELAGASDQTWPVPAFVPGGPLLLRGVLKDG
jgi:AAA+ ATPase superfamily predicted ATPase